MFPLAYLWLWESWMLLLFPGNCKFKWVPSLKLTAYLTLFGSFLFFRLFFFFLMWAIFKVLIEFATVLLLFYVLAFWPGGLWGLSPLTRDGTHTNALEGKVLTPRPPGKFCFLAPCFDIWESSKPDQAYRHLYLTFWVRNFVHISL